MKKEIKKLEKVIIFTDGACSGNPGPGGWGAIIIKNGKEKEISGRKRNTTNNEMEMTAVIKALQTLKHSYEVEIYSDSAYVINTLKKNWIKNWKSNGWKTTSGQPVKNKKLWLELDNLVEMHSVKFIKIKGHSNNYYNNRCDKLAVEQRKKYK